MKSFERVRNRNREWREMFQMLAFGPVVAFRWLARPGWPVQQVTENVSQFGYRSEDFLRRKILYEEIVHPEDRERVKREVEHYSEGGMVRFTQQYRILTADGGVRWIYDVSLVERRGKGRVVGYLGYIFDVTQTRQAQVDLMDSQTKFRNFIEQARDGMLLLDSRGKVIEWNNTLAELSQVSPGQAIGRYIWEVPFFLVGLDDVQTRRHFFGQYYRQFLHNSNALLEREIVLPDGSRRIAQITSFPILAAQGDLIGAVVRDVTELRQAELDGKRRLKELSLLYEATLAGLQSTSQDELIELVTDLIGRLLPADNYGIFLLDAKEQTLRYHPSYRGLPPDVTPVAGQLEQGLTGQAARTGKSVRVDDTRRQPDFWPHVPAIRSELCVPVKIGEQVIAVINLESIHPAAYSAADEHLLMTLAGYLATAIERQRLLEAERRRRQEAEILRAATFSLVGSLDVSEVLNAILENLQKVVDYDSATLFLYQDGGLVVAAGRGLPEQETILGRVFPADGPLFLRACAERKPIVIPDVREEPGFSGWLGTSYVRGWMGITLFAHDELVGYLTVDSRIADAYGPQDASMAQAFGNHAAIAIEHARLYEDIRDSFVQTALALANAIEARDQYTGDHSQQLSAMAEKIGQKLGLSEKELENLRWAAILHDIGKIGVPDHILRKPGPLTAEEWQVMSQHPEVGAAILEPVRQLRGAIPLIVAHQEKFNGSGYPAGLRGEQIPLGARILAVVDAYSAITDDRVYRPGRTHEQALEEIIACAGTHFDPRVVRVFIQLFSTPEEK